MNKIYHVVINGRTLESRNLKELLARAVTEKKNLNRKSVHGTPSYGSPLAGNAARLCSGANKIAVF
jgi:hypothetical protein